MPSPASNIKATAVILGGTGELGFHVSTVFLTEYRSAFPTIRITTRDTTSSKAKKLADQGADVLSFGESWDTVLSGADVVVNVLPTSVVQGFNKELVAALLKNSVKVYFPPSFGSDYRFVDFPGFEMAEWPMKRAVGEETRALADGKLKIISLMNGAFTSWVFRPDRTVGVDVANNTFTCFDPPSARFGVTDLADIGRAVAQLSVLALDPETAGTVPDVVRIAGQNVSMEDIRDAVARVKGVAPGKIVNLGDPAPAKKALRDEYPDSRYRILDYVRVANAEGQCDMSENDNELVNPGQSLWKWKTVDDQLRDIQ
ncbi:NAD(P)-binding protein [Polyporus arcularius HHB13444]|uniref:NAD(P)-binding protein n=1 Tax=Polyporus arcularius HHB13444 TaxID=1314778 RepID=A0A5C3PCU0_9APHY|nr:NAD(P)-binding protein [Polyporus arcularius HHB13444]